jgi:hypothetical protein
MIQQYFVILVCVHASKIMKLIMQYCYNVIYGYQTFTIPDPFAARLSLNIKAGPGVGNGHSITPFTLVTTTTTTTES